MYNLHLKSFKDGRQNKIETACLRITPKGESQNVARNPQSNNEPNEPTIYNDTKSEECSESKKPLDWVLV